MDHWRVFGLTLGFTLLLILVTVGGLFIWQSAQHQAHHHRQVLATACWQDLHRDAPVWRVECDAVLDLLWSQFLED